MKKTLILLMAAAFCCASSFAQSDDELFGSEEDFFSEDALFGDDGIEEISDISASSDLSRGVLFENGSIKIGGSFSTGLTTTTTLYADDDTDFGTHLKDTLLTPSAQAYLTLDARPSQELRMYTKFGLAYPYESKGISTASTTLMGSMAYTTVDTSISDWLSLKELFTDFSIKDTAFFRFGVHTVTWGTGYFFSPVSDMINTSSINPEAVDDQVDGSFNLRTQITFADSQNCLWLYVIPSTDFTNEYTFDSYLRDTALAGKMDIVLGGWELGAGAFWKYENAPKAMLTASGSIKNFSVFGEFVYQYGTASEWLSNTEWSDKTSVFQATAGFSRYWKNQNILLAVQYYYDSNDQDLIHKYLTQGHNIAAMANFGRIFGTTDVTASVFCMVNFGKEDLPELYKTIMQSSGMSTSFLNALTASAMLNYSPVSTVTLGLGPYLTWEDFDSAPVVALRFSATLGGGKF